jgi:general L-amino acid transport system permease protein
MTTTTEKSITEYLPPPDPPGIIKWLRNNLFNGWFNTILTIISVAVLYFAISNGISWIFTQADWTPVFNFPTLYSVGQYPREDLWRVGIGLSFFAFLLGASWRKWGGALSEISIFLSGLFLLLALLPVSHPELTTSMRAYLASVAITLALGFFLANTKIISKRTLYGLWLLFPIVFLASLGGFEGSSFLPSIRTTLWGGILVTFILAVGGILLSFPIGVALALGRRSTLPVVSAFSTIFIETIRGVPLVSILFMFSVILQLFLPPEARIDRLVRALMGMTLFSAAYTAENVRGGLQSIPPGQIEAAKALGMNSFQTMSLIVLPQAIRAVIPTIAGQFITLFKDTTLVVIVGINDLLGIGRSILNSDPQFLQAQMEIYLFIAAVYWIFSYFMSLASRRLETSLGVGYR